MRKGSDTSFTNKVETPVLQITVLAM